MDNCIKTCSKYASRPIRLDRFISKKLFLRAIEIGHLCSAVKDHPLKGQFKSWACSLQKQFSIEKGGNGNNVLADKNVFFFMTENSF